MWMKSKINIHKSLYVGKWGGVVGGGWKLCSNPGLVLYESWENPEDCAAEKLCGGLKFRGGVGMVFFNCRPWGGGGRFFSGTAPSTNIMSTIYRLPG